jgi:hypothetical protein
MSDVRQKAKDLMALSLDERTPEKERLSAAFKALQIIERHGLLDSPLEGILGSDNEAIKAGVTIFEKLTDPTFVGSVKKVAGGLSRARRRRSR